MQLGSECIDDSECIGFGILAEVSDVVPRVVVEERAVGMSALALEISEKIASHLAGMRYTNH